MGAHAQESILSIFLYMLKLKKKKIGVNEPINLLINPLQLFVGVFLNKEPLSPGSHQSSTNKWKINTDQ